MSFSLGVTPGEQTTRKECSVAVKMQVESIALSSPWSGWGLDLNGIGDFCVKDARDLVDEVLLPKENVA
ncbi:hypothetical protein Tco_1146391 [Tanacetum coccineum]